MGSLPQSTEAWSHKAREEDTNSSHWWFGVITDSQFKQFKDAGTGVKTRGAGKGMPFELEQGEQGAGGTRSRGVHKERRTPEHLLLGRFDFPFSDLNVFPYPL